MQTIDLIKEWISDHPTATSIFKYLIWLVAVLALVQLLRHFLRKRLPDSAIRYKTQKFVEIVGYFIIILLTISYFTGNIKDFALAVGLLTAGITITLQELILSIAGSLYIFVVKVYKPGDRIEIHGIKGDVIDVDSIYTTMMEIGEWVSSDNYTGRIVKLSNAFVFKGPICNYSSDFPFIWDEFNLPIRYGSDVDLAKEIVVKVARDQLQEYVQQSIADWKNVVEKYYIEDAMVDPTLAIALNENWIDFNLRYIVDYKKRRLTKHALNESIQKEFEKTNGKVELASSTIEVVKIPMLNIQNDENS